MSTPFTSSRGTAAVLGTWSGSERLAIESALVDAGLERKPARRLSTALRAAARRVPRTRSGRTVRGGDLGRRTA
jgi:hypothetical protein